MTCSPSDIVMVPNVVTSEFEVMDIDENEFVTVMLGDGSMKSNLKLP